MKMKIWILAIIITSSLGSPPLANSTINNKQPPLDVNLLPTEVPPALVSPSKSTTVFPSKQSNIAPLGIAANKTRDTYLFDLLNGSGSFEATDNSGKPLTPLTLDGSEYSESNGTYQAITHGGSYSGVLSSHGEIFSGDAYLHRYFSNYPFVDENLQGTFFYYLPPINKIDPGDVAYLYVSFSNTTSYYSVYYYLMLEATGIPSNQTNTKYLILNTTSFGTWQFFTRNFTRDFETLFGTISPPLYLSSFRYYLYNSVGSSNQIILIVDDVSLKNSTNYDYFAANGDFEQGDNMYWSRHEPSQSYYTTSSDSVEGNQSFNMTIKKFAPDASGYEDLRWADYYEPRGHYPYKPNTTLVTFSWKYNGTSNGGQHVYLEIQARNSSRHYVIQYYLSYDSQEPLPSNTSQTIIVSSPSLGTKNTWINETIDLYDLFWKLNYTNLLTYSFSFRIQLGLQANSSGTILFDDLKFLAHLNGDPEFEYVDNGTTYPIPGWRNIGNNAFLHHVKYSNTENWIANITSYGNDQANLLRYYNNWRVTDSLYLSFTWRIDQLNIEGNTMAYARITFDNSRELWYILGGTFNLANDSYRAYLLAPQFNITSQWNVFERNLQKDLNTTFGYATYHIAYVYLGLQTFGSAPSTVLFDNVEFFLDTTPPQLIELRQQFPPVYYRQTILEIKAMDEHAKISNITLSYTTSKTSAVLLGTKNETASQWFQFTFPAFSYGTIISYYITLSDIYGNSAIFDNAGLNYTVRIGDDKPPTIGLKNPVNNSILQNTIMFSTICQDEGSGVKFVEFYLNSTLIENVSQSPYSFEWNSRQLSNGKYELIIRAFDQENNIKTLSGIYLKLLNDFSAPLLSSLVLNPQIPQYGKPTTVYISAQDNSSIGHVTLYYQINNSEWKQEQMNESTILYWATIPPQPWGTIVNYYVIAADIYGQTATIGSENSPLAYIVKDLIPPEINVLGPLPHQTLTGVVNFTIIAQDDGSGISELTLTIDNETMSLGSTSPLAVLWDTTKVSNGVHNVTFTVLDNAGNSQAFSQSYNVENPKDLLAKAEKSVNTTVQEYGVYVGLGIAVTTYTAIQLLKKKLGKKKAT